MRSERWTDEDVCKGCGQHASRHDVEQLTGRLKCPVLREEKTTPPGEYARSPRGDY